MHDGSIQVSRVISGSLWLLTCLIYLAAWIVGLAVSWRVGVLLGFTGCLVCCMAGVSQIRCYSLRMCGLVRATAGLEIPPPAEVRPLR